MKGSCVLWTASINGSTVKISIEPRSLLGGDSVDGVPLKKLMKRLYCSLGMLKTARDRYSSYEREVVLEIRSIEIP